jgi:IS66 Orf2 like protein
MIGLPAGTRVRIAAGVTDLRRGFTGLSGLVQTALQENPFSGHGQCHRSTRRLWPEFSLVDRLPSAPSADDGLPSLFGYFAGTTRSSDSSPAFMLDLWFIAFSNRPAPFGVGRR